ncbi:putative bifunctional diguanylate cyclase/phosphodiesterase [Azohydromonas aeria]|uniref:putative bifunctional diguanylate cyclase/phosphodiesterase n=1 Tax=Azohydromonas aeria TaxID=2590212 RepID=UPI0018DF4B65|nr:GGDEF domain-containing phosphodiesterase [Azohydromonas aeria]
MPSPAINDSEPPAQPEACCVIPLPAMRSVVGDTLADGCPCMAEERLQLIASVFNATSDGIVITDQDARILEINDAFTAITGYSRSQVLGHTPALLSSGRHGPDFFLGMWEGLRTTGAWEGEIWNRRANGELVAEVLRIQAVHVGRDARLHYVGVFRDITSGKQQEWLARHDALTELPNRAMALEALQSLLPLAQRQGQQLAVCHLDFDGFMAVNEAMGPAQGDALLRTAAARVRQAVRSSDMVARFGGDEFMLLLGGLDTGSAAVPVLERVQHALAQPHTVGGESLRLSASIGVALYPGDGMAPEPLLRAADQAMYRAKQLGKNRVCWSGQGSERQAVHDALLQELGQALQAGEMCLHYQPKVCARTRRCLGVEALVRWQHPRRGLLPPGAFLPAVIGTPLEVALDRWVLREAVVQLVRWRNQGCELTVAVNVSPATLALPDLAGTVAAIVREAAPHQVLPLEGLELEVLETAALQDLEAAGRAIEACARQGIAFALDDFGTGYLSLSYLQRLPVNTLKIDRSFVASMLERRGDLHIVRAVIGLAAAFGVTTVAEGVETVEQAHVLADMGCHELQGYGIARPMPLSQLETWLHKDPAQRM